MEGACCSFYKQKGVIVTWITPFLNLAKWPYAPIMYASPVNKIMPTL